MDTKPARYCTAAGIGVPAVTAAQMREIDRIAIEETGPNLFQMMENAGRNLALQALEILGTHWREIAPNALDGERPDLLMDALIGYGLAAAPRGTVAEIIRWANDTGVPILSLDVPSGVDATTGETRGVAIRPASTMTLALPKTGLCAESAGDLVLADIGLPSEAFRRAGVAPVDVFGAHFRIPLTMS